ncbi:MAG: RNA-binding domain-containing protein [Opitutales bacterium]
MLNRPSLAADYFFRLTKSPNPSKFLCALVNSSPPTTETEWLEFKGGEKLDDTTLRKIFSECLSGFANTQGGVLIFGLTCRKTASGVDQVSALSLVPSPEAIRSRLMELHHQASDPPVLGFEVFPIQHHEVPEQGFVVCYVPESEFKPHRAELSGRKYLIRAGDDFVVPSVSLLRSLFHPTSQAAIVIEAVGDPSRTHPAITIYIKNRGNASARDVMLTVDSGGIERIMHTDPWNLHAGGPPRFKFTASRSLHPGESLELGTFMYNQLWRDGITMPRDFRFALKIKIFGENLPPTLTEVTFNDDDIAHRTKVICEMQPLLMHE